MSTICLWTVEIWRTNTVLINDAILFGVQWATVMCDRTTEMGQLQKTLYTCQNVMQIKVLLHFSPRWNRSTYRSMRAVTVWFDIKIQNRSERYTEYRDTALPLRVAKVLKMDS